MNFCIISFSSSVEKTFAKSSPKEVPIETPSYYINKYPKSKSLCRGMAIQNQFKIPLSNEQKQINHTQDDDDKKIIQLDLPYNGKLGEKLLTSLIKKLKRCFKEKGNIIVNYRTNKLSMFCPTKDRMSWNQKANVINHSMPWLPQ